MIPNRIVLDTNVCLDLFVFEDSRYATLKTALQNGDLQAVTRADCRTEWQLVLGYPCFGLDAGRRAECSARFDASILCLESPASAGTHSTPLPRCRDTDDQKFLEAARDTGAAVLLTRDKALLKLAGRCRRAGLFSILQPDAWTAMQACTTAIE